MPTAPACRSRTPPAWRARGRGAGLLAGSGSPSRKRPPYLVRVREPVTSQIDHRHRHRGGVPAQPDDHRADRVGAGPSDGGRFSLGLGTQVKAHIERRFSMPFEHPAAKLRDYVLAMRAIFRAFQGDGAAALRGRLLLVLAAHRLLLPGPSDHPDIPVSIAGVNVGMARLAGEVFDGFHVHPFHSPSVPRRASSVPRSPTARRRPGARRPTSRSYCPVFTIVGDAEPKSRRIATRSAASSRSTARPARTDRSSSCTAGPRQRASCTGYGRGRHRGDGRGDHRRDARRVRGHLHLGRPRRRRWWRRYGGLADRIFGYGPAQAWIDSPDLAERWRAVAAAVHAASSL